MRFGSALPRGAGVAGAGGLCPKAGAKAVPPATQPRLIRKSRLLILGLMDLFLVLEPVDEQRMTRRDRDVLPAVELIGDRRRRDRTANRGLPKQVAVARIERVEEALAATGEQQVGRRRHDAAVGD